jgi:chromosome segregation ATPase
LGMVTVLAPQIGLTLLGLILALVMTLLTIASYHLYEKTKKRLADRDEEIKSLQSGAQEFRLKVSEAFADQKDLKLRIETLERDLAHTNELLTLERQGAEKLRSELEQLRGLYETTKQTLTEAYKRMREQPQDIAPKS